MNAPKPRGLRIPRARHDWHTSDATESAFQKKLLAAPELHDAHNLVHEAEEANALVNLAPGLRHAAVLDLIAKAIDALNVASAQIKASSATRAGSKVAAARSKTTRARGGR